MRPLPQSRIGRTCAALGVFGIAFTSAVATQSVASAMPNRLVLRPLHLSANGPAASLAGFRRALGVPAFAQSADGTFVLRGHAAKTDAAAAKLRAMISAGDKIARLPYTWGGGHGSFVASGYDCSGSVSYVLHAAGLLSTPQDSSGLESFGVAGPGRYVTVYANGGHVWMTIKGRRYDTIAGQETGTRWSNTISSSAGYVVRHPAGL